MSLTRTPKGGLGAALTSYGRLVTPIAYSPLGKSGAYFPIYPANQGTPINLS